jgi:hypothetical protein
MIVLCSLTCGALDIECPKLTPNVAPVSWQASNNHCPELDKMGPHFLLVALFWWHMQFATYTTNDGTPGF